MANKSTEKYIRETHSTNALLKEMIRTEQLAEGFVLRTDFQTAGKGQVGNSWESEPGKNLLFSLVLYPTHVAIEKQFIISQMISVATVEVLNKIEPGFVVKWPNDIYFQDKKIAGILIENSLQNAQIKSMIIGMGLNVNQKEFHSDAPNPVSLWQITGKPYARKHLLNDILSRFSELYYSGDYDQIRPKYFSYLYRKAGFHKYKTPQEIFEAKICDVHPDGQMELETRAGEKKLFYFKEVEYVRN